MPNSKAWYGLNKTEIDELETLDRMSMKSVFNTPFSTPIEAVQLELGLISISTLIKARRINFLHYLVKRDESEMLSRFFKAQWDYPVRNDKTRQVRSDLEEFGINLDLDGIESKSTYSDPQPCQLCGLHLDNQETSLQCPEILEQLVIKHSYSEIFKKNVPVELFQTISRINSIRVEMLNK